VKLRESMTVGIRDQGKKFQNMHTRRPASARLLAFGAFPRLSSTPLLFPLVYVLASVLTHLVTSIYAAPSRPCSYLASLSVVSAYVVHVKRERGTRPRVRESYLE
jgi:hypothetical protein